MDGHIEEPWFLIYTPGYLMQGQQTREGDTARRVNPITIASGAHTEEIATVWNYLLPTEENAERIVACVNACAGISTEELNNMTRGLLSDLARYHRLHEEAMKTEEEDL